MSITHSLIFFSCVYQNVLRRDISNIVWPLRNWWLGKHILAYQSDRNCQLIMYQIRIDKKEF